MSKSLRKRSIAKAQRRATHRFELPIVPVVGEPVPKLTVEPTRPRHPMEPLALAAMVRFGSVDMNEFAEFLRGSPAPTPRERNAFQLVALDTLCDMFDRGIVTKDTAGRYHPVAG